MVRHYIGKKGQLQMKLSLKNVKKSVEFEGGNIEILKDVNISCESGEIVAVIGESGSGKSTLLNIISTVDCASGGEYILDGEDVFQYDSVSKRKMLVDQIGIVYQQYNLINNMTCFDNVRIPLFLNNKVSVKDRDGLIRKTLEEMGLEHRMTHYPKTMSGGEQQRAAIARAIINDPDIIVADEPTGNVDSKNEKLILEILKKIADKGKMVIIVTHSEVVKKFADKVYRIEDGVVKEEIV